MCRGVYLAASSNEQQLLIQRYLEDPKPVAVARRGFQARAGESAEGDSGALLPHADRRATAEL